MKVFVGCSSRDKIDPQYKKTAHELGLGLAIRGHDLVFGACNHGLMGILYQTMNNNNRDIVGVISEVYIDDLKELKIPEKNVRKIKDCSQRSATLINESDAIIFIEGGIGTLQEILTAIEAKRSGEIDKPIVILNQFGYYDSLLLALERSYQEGFTSEITKKEYLVTDNIAETLSYIENYHNIKDCNQDKLL